MERMPANNVVDTEAPAKPLLPLLTSAPDVELDVPAASQCCGGGSCAL